VARQSPQRLSGLCFLLGEMDTANRFNVPKLDRHNTWWATFMGCLVVCTPCSNCVADMAATEFDLRIVTHCLELLEKKERVVGMDTVSVWD
jgi:hypothetical protein